MMDDSLLEEQQDIFSAAEDSSMLKKEVEHHTDKSSSRSSVSSISGGGMLPLSAQKQTLLYHKLGFHGREAESRLIINALDRAKSSDSCNSSYCSDGSSGVSSTATEKHRHQQHVQCRSEVVLVSGRSGLGKSTLLKRLTPQLTAAAGAYVVSGKFDQMRNNEPFSAVVAAFTDLVDIVSHRDTVAANLDYDNDIGHHHTFSDGWDQEDARLLRQLISNLYDNDDDGSMKHSPSMSSHSSAASISTDGETNGVHGSANKATSVERLTACCCKFLCAVASSKNPVVLHLDDIQWADESSLALVRALVSDENSKNVLYVCSYRDQEVFQDHVRQFLETPLPVRVTEIQLTTFDLTSTNKMLADLLNMKEAKTYPLAEIVLRKTHGNPFFVVNFLESLEADGLLTKKSVNRWTWDVKRIQSETNVASNVADLVTARINRLPVDLQLLLKLAACMGFEFDRTLLDSFLINGESSEFGDILQGCCRSSKKKQTRLKKPDCCRATISRLLSDATDEGLVEKRSESKFKFVHDRIQQSLYDVIPDGVRKESMHLRIGELVWESSNILHQDWMVFAAAKHLNMVRPSALTGKMTCKRVAELNLEAAKVSAKKAALTSALEFLRIALSLLEGSNKWDEHYDLMLSLVGLFAEIECSKGNIARSKELIQEITRNGRSLEDKLQAHYIMIDCLGTEGKLREAMALGFSTLGKLGCRFPKKVGLRHVVWELLKAKRMLRGMTDEKLLNLPLMTDGRKLARMRLASLISVYAPFLGEEKTIVVLYLRVIQMCIRDGNSYLSATAFAMYGMIEAASGNTKSAARIGLLGLKMIDKMGSRQCGVVPVNIIRCGMIHWIEPVRASLEPLDRNLEMGIAWGESKGSFYALQVYFAAAMHVGEPLEKLENRMRNVCEQKEQFDFVQESAVLVLMLIRPMWQAVLNLQGNASESAVLSGEALSREEFMKHAEGAGNFGALVNWRLNQLQLAYVFGDYDLALKTAKDLEKKERFFSFHFNFYYFLFFSGLAYVAKYEETGERQYKSMARKIIKKLEKIGNFNSRPLLQILRAQLRSLNVTNIDLVQIYYDEAIATVRKAQLPNLEALANELAWEASIKKQFAQPKSYLARAIQLYSQWGATGKVDSLEKMALSLPATDVSTVRKNKKRPGNNLFEITPPGGIAAGPVWAG